MQTITSVDSGALVLLLSNIVQRDFDPLQGWGTCHEGEGCGHLGSFLERAVGPLNKLLTSESLCIRSLKIRGQADEPPRSLMGETT